MDILAKFKDPALCKQVLEQIQVLADREIKFMEVCGTHTVSIFQSGIRSLLPENIVHLSGPGCPVCVTHEREVAAFLALAEQKEVIIATFGDLMRVPGPGGRSLKSAQADGAQVEIVYSPFDALQLAAKNPEHKIVFLGVGFETTAPTVAATVQMARQQALSNFYVFSCHKLVPPALDILVQDKELEVQAFMLPGHVCTVTGLQPFQFLSSDYGLPAVVAGFEPFDILKGILGLVQMVITGPCAVRNEYPRAVADEGNAKARQIMDEVFKPSGALWRGIGEIDGSGLVFQDKYLDFDALQLLDGQLPTVAPLPGCKCGEVLKGKLRPSECPLFKTACTPASPLGPCMVSTEGSCAAYFKYQL